MNDLNFLDLLPEIPVAQKIAANWDTQSHLVDPLDNDETSPHAAVPNWKDKLKSVGRVVGGIGGGLAGLALPMIAGAATGAAGAYGLEHLTHDYGIHANGLLGSGAEHFAKHLHMDNHPLGTGFQIGSGLAGAAAAAPIALTSTPIGAGVGALTGEQSGGFAGKQLEKMYSPERQAAERIRRLPANHGLALIRTMEQTGQATPAEIDAMKQTYNARRDGLRDQSRAMVI